MEYPQLIDPEQGRTYLNRNGCTYRCTQRIDGETAVMVRETDGWTLVAHRIRQFADGTIEWDHSTDGHWPDGMPKASPGPVSVRKEDKNGDWANSIVRAPGQSGG